MNFCVCNKLIKILGCENDGIEKFDGETFSPEVCVECTCLVSTQFLSKCIFTGGSKELRAWASAEIFAEGGQKIFDKISVKQRFYSTSRTFLTLFKVM